jgi:hypothetical protein
MTLSKVREVDGCRLTAALLPRGGDELYISFTSARAAADFRRRRRERLFES